MNDNKVRFSWSQFLVGGLVALVYGLLALLLPATILDTFMTVSGIVVAVAGVIWLIVAINRKKKGLPWSMSLFEAIVMILLGAAAIVWSQKTAEVLIVIIGIWVAIIGLMQLLTLLSLSKFVYRGVFLVCSLLAITFGVIMIFNPFESAEFFVKLTGVIALLVGIMTIMFSFAIRSINGKINKQIDREIKAENRKKNAEIVEDAEVIED